MKLTFDPEIPAESYSLSADRLLTLICDKVSSSQSSADIELSAKLESEQGSASFAQTLKMTAYTPPSFQVDPSATPWKITEGGESNYLDLLPIIGGSSPTTTTATFTMTDGLSSIISVLNRSGDTGEITKLGLRFNGSD